MQKVFSERDQSFKAEHYWMTHNIEAVPDSLNQLQIKCIVCHNWILNEMLKRSIGLIYFKF